VIFGVHGLNAEGGPDRSNTRRLTRVGSSREREEEKRAKREPVGTGGGGKTPARRKRRKGPEESRGVIMEWLIPEFPEQEDTAGGRGQERGKLGMS